MGGKGYLLLGWIIAPERVTRATTGAPSVRIFLHEKWQLKDGKHSEESAEVGLTRGRDKSELALGACGGWGGGFQARLQPLWRDYIAQI